MIDSPLYCLASFASVWAGLVESRCQRAVFGGMDVVDAGVGQCGEDGGCVVLSAGPPMIVV